MSCYRLFCIPPSLPKSLQQFHVTGQWGYKKYQKSFFCQFSICFHSSKLESNHVRSPFSSRISYVSRNLWTPIGFTKILLICGGEVGTKVRIFCNLIVMLGNLTRLIAALPLESCCSVRSSIQRLDFHSEKQAASPRTFLENSTPRKTSASKLTGIRDRESYGAKSASPM